MSDEDRIRSLMTLAADLPDDIQPPVTGLLNRGPRPASPPRRQRHRERRGPNRGGLRAAGCTAVGS